MVGRIGPDAFGSGYGLVAVTVMDHKFHKNAGISELAE
jgi:hypothetical protein